MDVATTELLDNVTEHYDAGSPVDHGERVNNSDLCIFFQLLLTFEFFTAPEALRRAIQNARHVFLENSCGIYEGSWHKTSCIVKGKSIECLVIPPHSRDQNPGEEIGIIFDPVYTKGTDYYYTHDIDCGGKKQCDRTRLKLQRKGRSELIDPFDMPSYGMYMFNCLQKRFKCHISYFTLLL